MWTETLPDGRFKFIERYTDPLTQKYKRVSTIMTSDSARAANKARKILDDKINKKLNNVGKIDLTFKELFEKFFEIHKAKVTFQSAKHTISLYKVACTWFDESTIVRNLTAPFIQEKINDFYYKKGFSYSYTTSLKGFLHNIFEYGKSIGACDYNVIKEISLKKSTKTKKEERKKDNKYLERDELVLVLSEIKKWPKVPRKFKYAEILELQSLTGMRFGEAAGLKKEDLNGNQLQIRRTLHYNYGKLQEGDTGDTKNRFSERTILLSDRSLEILHKWIDESELYAAQNPKFNDMGFLFCDTDGTPIGLSPVNRILRNVRTILKKEGLLDKEITTHYFRHTHISQLAELGIPLKTIMDRVGHANASTTLNIYTHVTKKMSETLLEKLNALEKNQANN